MDKNAMRSILEEHLRRYPEMQPQDLVKLLYQNEFGCGHMIQNPEGFLDYIRQEAQGVQAAADSTDPDAYTVSIGDGFYRVDLTSVSSGHLSAEALAAACLYTARTTNGSKEAFEKKLKTLEELCCEGCLPSVDAYLLAYRAAGCPAVHHSDRFRDNYKPAYRVVSRTGLQLLKALQAADACIRKTGHAVLAIDGNCGSGKSLVCDCISAAYGAGVVHMDDFFLQPSQRSLERLREPGGNIDYERFEEEVLPGLRSGQSFVYRVFDCGTQKFSDLQQVSPTALRVVEGSYSLHQKFRDVYDVKVFLSVDPVTQVQRIEARDGARMLGSFLSRWIPMESTYHKAQEVMQCCDFIVYT